MTFAQNVPLHNPVSPIAFAPLGGVSRYAMVEGLTFGEFIKTMRDRKRLSQKALAAAIGIDRKTMGQIENVPGYRFEDERRIVGRLSDVLGVAVEVLYQKLDSRPPVDMPADPVKVIESLVWGLPHLSEEKKATYTTVIRDLLKPD